MVMGYWLLVIESMKKGEIFTVQKYNILRQNEFIPFVLYKHRNVRKKKAAYKKNIQ